MKKYCLLFTLVFVSMMVFSCTKTVQESLDLSVSSLSMDAAGNPVTFTVYASNNWKIDYSGDIPLKILPSSGNAGQSVTVTLSANENNTGGVRTATVSVNAGHLDKTITVNQINSTIAGKARILQKGKASRPPVIFFTGDGYTSSQIEDG
ncbi:MAG: BACON domain-containing protein, partial [Bacteroidales bacterium]|nr:BACON domain-containing protein [Bacteroidales bacterium]